MRKHVSSALILLTLAIGCERTQDRATTPPIDSSDRAVTDKDCNLVGDSHPRGVLVTQPDVRVAAERQPKVAGAGESVVEWRPSPSHPFSATSCNALILAEQRAGDKWLEEHPQVLGAIILAIAMLNLLFALTLLLVAFIITRKMRNLPPIAQIAAYAPGALFCAIVIVMMLFAAYLFCGGSPSFR